MAALCRKELQKEIGPQVIQAMRSEASVAVLTSITSSITSELLEKAIAKMTGSFKSMIEEAMKAQSQQTGSVQSMIDDTLRAQFQQTRDRANIEAAHREKLQQANAEEEGVERALHARKQAPKTAEVHKPATKSMVVESTEAQMAVAKSDVAENKPVEDSEMTERQVPVGAAALQKIRMKPKAPRKGATNASTKPQRKRAGQKVRRYLIFGHIWILLTLSPRIFLTRCSPLPVSRITKKAERKPRLRYAR